MIVNKSELIKARFEKGMGQGEASKKSGISRATLYRLETGTTSLANAKTIAKLALTYGKDVFTFLEEGE